MLSLTLLSGCISPNNSDYYKDPEDIYVNNAEIPTAILVINDSISGYGEYAAYNFRLTGSAVSANNLLSSETKSSMFLLDLPESYKKLNVTSKLNLFNFNPTLPLMNISHLDQTYTFNVNDISLTARLRYGNSSSRCLIYTENTANSSINLDSIDWASIGDFFDNTVYTKITANFAIPSDIDSNQKIVLLYCTMPIISGGTLLGYFNFKDLYAKQSNSNGMEMVYLNINLLNRNAYTQDVHDATIAHESFHLFNYGSRVLSRKQGGLDTWIEEGIAESVAHYVINKPLIDRINVMKSSTQIRDGMPLIYWLSEGAQYAVTYTFFQYCRIQSKDGWNIFRQILNNDASDYRNIETIMKNQNNKFTNFKTLVLSYRIANLLNNNLFLPNI